MSNREFEISNFKVEIEAVIRTRYPLNANPFRSVVLKDFSPNCNVVPPTRLAGASLTNGAFAIIVTNVTPHFINFVPTSATLSPPSWQTIGTNVATTNSLLFTDPDAASQCIDFVR